jgi:hypothetical protein
MRSWLTARVVSCSAVEVVGCDLGDRSVEAGSMSLSVPNGGASVNGRGLWACGNPAVFGFEAVEARHWD